MNGFLTYRADGIEIFDPVSDCVDLAFDALDAIFDRLGSENVLELLMCLLDLL